jgi:O-antigen/teichoic acid export membrane protein
MSLTNTRQVLKKILRSPFRLYVYRQILRIPLYNNALFLLATYSTSAILGLVFWAIVARIYSTEEMGLGSALISVAGFLCFIASLGLGETLIRFLPDNRKTRYQLVNYSLTLSGLAAVFIAMVFVIGIPLWSPALHFVLDDFLFLFAIVFFVMAATIYNQVGVIYIALRSSRFLFFQNLIANVLRLILVVVLANFVTVLGIFSSWGIATMIAAAVAVCYFLPGLQSGYRPAPTLRSHMTSEIRHFSFANYISNGLWNLPTWLLPLIVVNRLGSQANAYFFASWAISGLLFAIPGTISTSLFAEGSNQNGSLAKHVRRSLKLISFFLIPAAVFVALLGGRLLFLFGEGYSKEATNLLLVLVFSTFPLSINAVYLGIARVRKNLRQIIVITFAIAFIDLVLSYFLIPHLGLMGIAAAWLLSQSVCALAAIRPLYVLLVDKQTGNAQTT